jgi:Zn-dependent peptidase ImmA (M78 family)/transcriptional regulator with XRE-family HTH domain
MDGFNHHMMILARDSRGLTQEGLADELGVTQGTLSKFETGTTAPPDEFVSSLSNKLRYQPSFFYEPGRPYGFPPFHYRKRKKLSAKALARIVAEMNIRRIHIQKLKVSFGAFGNGFIPEIDRDEYVGRNKSPLTPETAARHIREMWMLPDGPVENMMATLEDNGAIVVPCDFGSDLIDAMSQRIDGMPVLVFVNVNSPADRLRHTLAHELAHMILHTLSFKGDDDMEDEADAFAGAFLLPADLIRPQLRRFDLPHLANLKSYWKVSMASIAVRADRLKVITPYQSRQFWIQMSRLGYRTREPNEPKKELPTLLRRMIEFHIKKLGYSHDQLSKFLHLTLDEFRSMYARELSDNGQNSGPVLRIVK